MLSLIKINIYHTINDWLTFMFYYKCEITHGNKHLPEFTWHCHKEHASYSQQLNVYDKWLPLIGVLDLK